MSQIPLIKRPLLPTRLLPVVSSVALALVPGWVGAEENEDKIDFDREIRPILSEYCFHCHGPDAKTREAGLRLDTQEGAFTVKDGVKPVIPGNADKSEIILRILTDDKEKVMPPPKSKRTMKPEEIEKLKRWINEGAEWAEHWAFRPIETPAVPQVEKHPIDAFLAQRLKKEGMKFSPEANKTALIRRVSLDLIGIPPTPEEVTAFVNDTSENAYEKLVDRLLASPRYGERMAWAWLDAARYADTDGFQGDPTRNMWPWRDWLIGALNENMPFDQFTVEMLAGDMLPNATPKQRLASAFNRNHSFNNEGGRIPEETRVENVLDRVDTTSTVWLGMTMSCARCHDHKFDPISQKEYFELYAFFDRTSETGRNGFGKAAPTLDYFTAAQQQQLDQIKAKQKQLHQEMTGMESQFLAARPRMEQTILSDTSYSRWLPLDPSAMKTESGVALQKLKDNSFRANGKNPISDTYEIIAQSASTDIASLRLEALPDLKQKSKALGRDKDGNFVLTDLSLFIRPLDAPDSKFRKVAFSAVDGEHTQKAFSPAGIIDDQPKKTGWAIDRRFRKESSTVVLHLEKPVQSPAGFEIKVKLMFQSKYKYHNLARGRLSISPRKETLNSGNKIAEDGMLAMLVPVGERSAEHREAIDKLQRLVFFKKQNNQLAKLKKREEEITKKAVPVMIMDELPANKHRKVRILDHGSYDKPVGDLLTAGTPEFLPPMDKNAPRNRLTLARWLVSPENPLTARVTVNRYWQTFFGRGLVSTAEDFGSQGAKPTHPKLLDWLAAEFIRSGWDVKAMHRLIVTSRGYQQSSRVPEHVQEKDPKNLYYSHAPRYRMPSWMLRDQALAVSGLLNTSMGGPGVKPYQPEGIWAEATFGKIKYKPDTDDRIYRRSVYVFWRRIVGPTMFFDVAKRQECEVLNSKTNTPLHALTTLNEPLFVESARKMAERVLMQPADARIDFAFQLATSRLPDEGEKKSLQERLKTFTDIYSKDAKAVKALLGVGNSPLNVKIDATECAAWTVICSILLNLDETQNKE